MTKPLFFDREKFFKGYREQFGPLTQQQTDGLTFILDAVEKDQYIERVEWLAYMLATTKLETAHTFQPIHEYGGRAYFIRRYGSQTKVGKNLGNDTQEEGAIYAGRGDVQLTGEDNYEKAEAALRKFYPDLVADFEQRTGRKFDLTVGDQPGDIRDADNAQDPAIAYAIMSFGMRTGMFTGKKLSDYINAKSKDYKNARRIINGLDHWQLIKTAAEKFEIILKASKSSAAASSGEVDQPLADTELTPVDSPDIGGNQSNSNEQSPGFKPETIQQVMPKITNARRWLGGGAVSGFFAMVSTKMAGMPDWMVMMIGVFIGMCLAGLIVVIIQNRHNLGKLFNKILDINADPALNNIEPK